jgi:hypothetical protein
MVESFMVALAKGQLIEQSELSSQPVHPWLPLLLHESHLAG